MIHILTMGHLDPTAVGRRQAIVLRPLDMGIANRLLQELGGRDERGRPTLDDVPVEIKDGTVACRWLIGGCRAQWAWPSAVAVSEPLVSSVTPVSRPWPCRVVYAPVLLITVQWARAMWIWLLSGPVTPSSRISNVPFWPV